MGEKALPTRGETYQIAAEIIEEALAKYGNDPQHVWKGIYTALLWYEYVEPDLSLPHIIDADKLRVPRARLGQGTVQKQPGSIGVWRRRAEAVNKELAKELGFPASRVASEVDRLMRHPAFSGLQRQNPLGTAFTSVIVFVLERFSSPRLQYESEVLASDLFPGIRLPGRSSSPRIDIIAKIGLKLRAIISAKWSLRHDRINDLTSECPIYKGIAYQMWRFRPSYNVVTNEFDPARLDKLLSDPCVDHVFHINKHMVTSVCGLNDRTRQLLDVADLIRLTKSW